MKIKRFVAGSMREALARVREDQGPEAVIISNRRVSDGIELITAVDYDETLIRDALERLRPAAESAPAAALAPAPPPPAPPPAAVAGASAEPGRAAQAAAEAAVGLQLAWSQDPGMLGMRREVETLRQMLQHQLGSLAWSDRLRREPLRAHVLRDLSRLGLAPDVARTLAEQVPAGADPANTARIAAALTLRALATTGAAPLERGGIVAVVGATGAGKTTSIAKLAARWALSHGTGQVALVSLDHYRIGARDQLLTFARILGVTMHLASNRRELGAILGRLGDRSLVLIDTAGMSPKDSRHAEQLHALAVPGLRIRTLLALAANAEQAALEAVVRCHRRAAPEALLLTKIDEAASLGPALTVALRHALPLAWLADGQRVPDDLHAAAGRKVWLVKRAMKLASASSALAGVDDAYLSEHFGKVVSHG